MGWLGRQSRTRTTTVPAFPPTSRDKLFQPFPQGIGRRPRPVDHLRRRPQQHGGSVAVDSNMVNTQRRNLLDCSAPMGLTITVVSRTIDFHKGSANKASAGMEGRNDECPA